LSLEALELFRIGRSHRSCSPTPRRSVRDSGWAAGWV